MSAQPVTSQQEDRIKIVMQRAGATSVTVERDDPHDSHVFVSFYGPADDHGSGRRFLGEHVIDADGRCCDGICATAPEPPTAAGTPR